MLHRHGVHDRPSADAKASRCSAAGALVHTRAGAAADLVHDGNRALAGGDAKAAAERYLEALEEEPDRLLAKLAIGF